MVTLQGETLGRKFSAQLRCLPRSCHVGEVLPPMLGEAAVFVLAAWTSRILNDTADQGKGAWGEGVGVLDVNVAMTNSNVMCCSDAIFCGVCNAERGKRNDPFSSNINDRKEATGKNYTFELSTFLPYCQV